METVFFFFLTLVTGPRRSLSLNLSDTRVYEPGNCGAPCPGRRWETAPGTHPAPPGLRPPLGSSWRSARWCQASGDLPSQARRALEGIGSTGCPAKTAGKGFCREDTSKGLTIRRGGGGERPLVLRGLGLPLAELLGTQGLEAVEQVEGRGLLAWRGPQLEQPLGPHHPRR